MAELLPGTFRFASGILPAIPETICPGGGGDAAKCIKEYKGKLRNTKEYPGIPRNTRNTKEYQGILRNTRNTKEYQGRPRNTRNIKECRGIQGILRNTRHTKEHKEY